MVAAAAVVVVAAEWAKCKKWNAVVRTAAEAEAASASEKKDLW